MQKFDDLFSALQRGDRGSLARAITIIESRLASDEPAHLHLLQLAHSNPSESIRLAITGAPGTGKSSLIEELGMLLVRAGKTVAVLAIDPSSERTGGSILGDKTRMTRLSKESGVFIRPSPTSGILGGVAEKTREVIAICESAGFDYILVETVGVGQSETTVSRLVDVVLFVTIAGSGDALQGIKRGILETADLVTVNKCDGSGEQAAGLFALELEQALRLLRGAEHCPPILTSSALTGVGIETIAQKVDGIVSQRKQSGAFNSLRKDQRVDWFEDAVSYLVEQHISVDPGLQQFKKELISKIATENTSPYLAARSLTERLLKSAEPSRPE